MGQAHACTATLRCFSRALLCASGALDGGPYVFVFILFFTFLLNTSQAKTCRFTNLYIHLNKTTSQPTFLGEFGVDSTLVRACVCMCVCGFLCVLLCVYVCMCVYM